MGSASVDAKGIKNLDVSWAAGSVDIAVVDGGDAIELAETAATGLTKAQQMRWSVQGDTLKIDYGSWWSCLTLGQKRLEVRIPRDCAEALGTVSVDGASGYYALADLGCERLRLKLASGEVAGSGLRADELDIDVASGQLNVAGSFAGKVKARVASGWAGIDCAAAPKAADINLASGELRLALPASTGFTAKVSKASGGFSSDFETVMRDGVYVHGDGATAIDVRLASGQVTLERSGR